MSWADLLDNIVPIALVAIWLASALLRIANRKKARAAKKTPQASRLRRRMMFVTVALGILAVMAFQLSGSFPGPEGQAMRAAALILAVIAVLSVLLSGFIRPKSPMQSDIKLEPMDKRAGEIRAGKPLEPR